MHCTAKSEKLTLDILGAAVIGFGIYQNSNSSKLYADYKKPPATKAGKFLLPSD
ncbi:MAG: hypothetical protein LBC85_07425 [Fibromonadaceae bacterium]|jgi:hypothetical protein|nr:hypothetical protein [Fibromonadaceae bacterium]